MDLGGQPWVLRDGAAPIAFPISTRRPAEVSASQGKSGTVVLVAFLGTPYPDVTSSSYMYPTFACCWQYFDLFISLVPLAVES